MKKTLIFALVCLAALSMFGCETPESGAPTTSDPVTESTTEPEPPAKTQATDYSAVYAEYLGIYRDNQWDIAQYNWSAGDGQVAICDIIGDATPELLFLAAASASKANLSIYHYADNGAARVYNEPTDLVAGSGTYYCVFTTADSKVYLYERSAGTPMTYSFKELVLDSDNQLIPASMFLHERTPSEDYATFTHKYQQDGAEISESEFATLENELVGSMKDVVVWSCTEGDGAVWEKISEIGTSLAMSAEDAIQFLINQAGVAGIQAPASTSSTSGDFSQDAAIAFLTRVIAQSATADEIAEKIKFTAIMSDKLYDDQPIYLIKYTIVGAGDGKALVFADGTTIGKNASNFANYKGYFDTDITAD